MSIQGTCAGCCWGMPVYWKNIPALYKMYGNDPYGGVSLTSCPICYCMVDEKFMSMHIMWHEENDTKEEDYPAEMVPIDRIEYEL